MLGADGVNVVVRASRSSVAALSRVWIPYNLFICGLAQKISAFVSLAVLTDR
jgi:hypothetical protein